MITRRELVAALGRRGMADWVLLEREQHIASIDEAARVRRGERRVLWQLTVHVDSPAGRGSAHVMIDAVAGVASEIVDQAIALAQSSIGPAWVARPLAAPARVELEDTTVTKQEPLAIAASVLKNIKRATEVTARASLLREDVTATSRQGFRTEWRATLFRVDGLVVAGDRSLTFAREARAKHDLDVDAAVVHAGEHLQLLATAGVPVAGPCALVLRTDALLHDGLGVWSAFAHQADAVVERQGLTRYRERTPIVPGAEQLAEPLTITSNGALALGVRSAPIGDHGDAVRKFRLVERGVAMGLGLSPREAALRGRDPNGGVRNLEVEPGTWSGAVDAGALRVVEVHRLRSLSIDPYTGDASLEIGLAVEHAKGAPKPFSGGSLRIDLIAALARAKRSTRVLARGAYKGPDAVWIERADLIA